MRNGWTVGVVIALVAIAGDVPSGGCSMMADMPPTDPNTSMTPTDPDPPETETETEADTKHESESSHEHDSETHDTDDDGDDGKGCTVAGGGSPAMPVGFAVLLAAGLALRERRQSR